MSSWKEYFEERDQLEFIEPERASERPRVLDEKKLAQEKRRGKDAQD